VITTIVIGAFVLAGVCAGIRLLIGPSLADRVAALDVMLIALMSGIAAAAADSRDPVYLELLVVVAIVAFTATVAASRFIESEGRDAR
jgi:multicomponent Na+:H+ antiporter subunit F